MGVKTMGLKTMGQKFTAGSSNIAQKVLLGQSHGPPHFKESTDLSSMVSPSTNELEIK